MKKPSLLAVLALTTMAAYAQQPSLQGAKVTHLQGQVQVKESSVWRLLQEGEQLAESTLLRLAQGAHLSLRFRSDGHREEAQGPGEMVVGKEQGGSAKVERYGFRNRPLQIPRSGGLDAVGGSVANASFTRPAKPITEMPGSPIIMPSPPSMTTRGGPHFPPDLSPPLPAPMELAWDSDGPSLTHPTQGGLQVGEFGVRGVLFEGDRELDRVAMRRDQPFRFQDQALQPDRLYRVQFEEDGVYQGAMTFRLLDAEERGELEKLSAPVFGTGQHLERMDRFSELGEYHLACEEGKRWLFDTNPKDDPEKTAAILQVVYDMSRDMLKDTRQVEYWQAWAEVNKVSLIP